MGIKHLEQVEAFLRSRPTQSFTKTQIRDELRIWYKNVLDALSYLLAKGEVEQISGVDGIEKYRWKGE